MEGRKDLGSILPFIPLIQRSSALLWPSPAEEALKALSLGPDLSRVDSGEVFFDAILDLRDALGLSHDVLASKAANGYALFFDKVLWFPCVFVDLIGGFSDFPYELGLEFELDIIFWLN